jgi:hypothetical protein
MESSMIGYKLITCIVSDHNGADIIKALKDEKNIVTADRSFARGSSIHNQEAREMEIITVIVEESISTDIFTYLYEKYSFDQPHKGIIYQTSLSKSSKYSVS